MNMVQCFLIIALVFPCMLQTINASVLENLRCLICKHIIEGVQENIKSVDPNKKIEIGGYRLDADGRSKSNIIPYALSEMHLTDALESACKNIDDYVRAADKETGELLLLKIIVDGKMNPKMSEVDIIQDGDLNKSLKYYCDGIVEEYEESIVKRFQEKNTNVEHNICVEEAKLCTSVDRIHDDL